METIEFDDLLAACSGKMEEGVPCSSVLFEIVTNEQEDYVGFEDAVNVLAAYGETLVMETFFPSKTAERVLTEAYRLAKSWIDNLRNADYRANHELHVMVTPLTLDGQIVIDLHDIMYATFFEVKDGWKFITVFTISEDKNAIEFLYGESIDVEETIQLVRQEVLRELDRLDEEYGALEDQLDKLRGQNEYTEFLEENYGNLENTDDEENPDMRFGNHRDPWFRMSDD